MEIDSLDPKLKVTNNRIEAGTRHGAVLHNCTKPFETIRVSPGFEMFIQNLKFEAGFVYPNSISIGSPDNRIKGNPFVLRGVIVPHDMSKHCLGFDLVEFFLFSVDIP
jgi:hypothetical protein